MSFQEERIFTPIENTLSVFVEFVQSFQLMMYREKSSSTVESYTPLEAHLIAGFENILKFVEENDCPPEHGESKDIFERI